MEALSDDNEAMVESDGEDDGRENDTPPAVAAALVAEEAMQEMTRTLPARPMRVIEDLMTQI